MYYRDESKIVDRLTEDYESLTKDGFSVFGVYLQGSQNYNLDTEYSDIDTKAIVIPSFEDIVLKNKPISTTLVKPDNSHLDVKDIRVMFDCFKKQNINFLEILFTKYRVTNDKYKKYHEELDCKAERIAHTDKLRAIKCMSGMSKAKFHALEHPYPTILDKINKFGYDPKQLHHIIRMNEFIRRYVSGISFRDCLVTTNKENLISVKLGKYTLEQARYLANEYDKNTEMIYTLNAKEFEKDVVDWSYLDAILLEIMKVTYNIS